MSSWQTNLNDFISSNIDKLNILHLNINSVFGLEKRLGLDSILVSQKYDLVIIQESKIGVDIPDESFNYQSYQLFRRNRFLGAGGILVFLKKSHKVIFSYIDPIFETIALTLILNKMNFNLITSYNSHFEFRNDHLKHFEQVINMFSASSKSCIIGDFNQDLLTNKGDLLASSMSDYNFHNVVVQPTHFQGTSASLIDACFFNDPLMLNSCCVIPCPFSNHCFVACSFNLKPPSSAASTISARVLNEKNLSMINNKLVECSTLFDIVDVYDDVNDKFHTFCKIVADIVDEFAPIKKSVSKKTPLFRGWIKNYYI